MTDRIDPGPGWRLLKVGEKKMKGYEWWAPVPKMWREGASFGEKVAWYMTPCRVRIAPRTTKAIATRATVRIAFVGCTVDRTVSSPGGLSADNMDAIATHFADRARAYQTQGVAKYIMLEIQREGEP